MTSFFTQTAEARLSHLRNQFPILKLEVVINWSILGNELLKIKSRYLKSNKGRHAYPLLPMFKAILLGQWHSLSDPELEKALITRLDFLIFCGFDDLETPDHSTLNRFRNWLIASGQLESLLKLVNTQLVQQGLKVEKAKLAIVDATIIETAGKKNKRSISIEEDEAVVDNPPSTDKDARWIKKGPTFHLGYKQHTRVDEEGYVNVLTVTPANVHDSKQFSELIVDVKEGTEVQADKGYASKENRQLLQKHQLKDGIMHKAVRAKEQSKTQRTRNREIKKSRYVVEQTFGTLKRIFNYARASYFGLVKVKGQSILKAMCLNLLKACNKIQLYSQNPSKNSKIRVNN